MNAATWITHPGARTRALYGWEECDLKHRSGVRAVWFPSLIVRSFWYRFRVTRLLNGSPPAPPRIEWKDGGAPECIGRSLIRLPHDERLNITLIHELVHALGFGSYPNPHNRAFVKQYIKALNWWFRWEIEELELQAHSWRLI